MKDKQVERKLLPITRLEQIAEIALFRDRPVELPKTTNISPPGFVRHVPWLRDIWRFAQVTGWLWRGRLDMVMGIYLVPHGIIAGLAARLNAKPVIQNIVGKDLSDALKYRWLSRFVKRADAVICRGPVTRERIETLGIASDKIFAPPNLFDFSALPRDIAGAEKEYDLISMGTLVEKKNFPQLLAAVHTLKTRMGQSEIRVAILGKGRLRKKLEALRTELGLENNVEFLGFRKNVYDYLLKSRIFVLLSENEGLPMAMIEAMGCGLPCVVTDDADIPSVAQHGYNAFVVSAGDSAATADCIHALLTDRDEYERMSANAAAIRAEKSGEYSMANIVRIWREVLGQIHA